MNEASSKYVDRLATEKLLKEKLTLVRHVPAIPVRRPDPGLAEFERLQGLPREATDTGEGKDRELSFVSAVDSGYPKNDRVHCRLWMADEPAGTVVFVHGLYEENLDIHSFLLSALRKNGFSVCAMTLPYHYDRKPDESIFSGEFFWSGDMERSVRAYRQAVFDLFQTTSYARERFRMPVVVVGFSMGAGIALTLAGLTSLDGVFVINPVCNISGLVWTSALFSAVRRDLEEQSITLEDVRATFAGFEPLNGAGSRTDGTRITLGRSLYDQINDPANYDLLMTQRGIQNVCVYKAGHLNVLRVPKLAADVLRFCRTIGRNELR